jgi:hypothetical protein
MGMFCHNLLTEISDIRKFMSAKMEIYEDNTMYRVRQYSDNKWFISLQYWVQT